MEEITLSSSQESLLPFSQETYNYLFNILSQDESGQFLCDLNDLSETVIDPPKEPSPRSSLPGTADWPGDVGFKVTFGSNYEAGAKNVNWVYSEKEKKLYVKKDAPCPISFSTSLLIPPGRTVRATALYQSPEHVSEVVKRCLHHAIPELAKKMVQAEHLIRNESSAATYHEDAETKRHSVVIPFVNPPSGHSCTTYLYKFVCFNSCYGGSRRRSLTLVFTLEENNKVIGRHSLNLKICACPGRDSGIEKPAVPNKASSSKKRKVEPRPQAKLPKRPISNFKPKRKSEGNKEFTIETKSLECYNFLRVMRRLYYFNEKMIQLPEELHVFFNLLRSSSSEDEKSQDEENGTDPNLQLNRFNSLIQ